MKPAVIFDIDGTLATMADRSPYDWSRVGDDVLVLPVAALLKQFERNDYAVLIFSGRDSVCRKETEGWLKKNDIFYRELHMRKEKDYRKDVVVKREFYDACKDRYDIQYAVDDRLQVCRLWYELGICLLRVGNPDADF